MHQEYLEAFADKAASDAHILAAWLEGSFVRSTAPLEFTRNHRETKWNDVQS